MARKKRKTSAVESAEEPITRAPPEEGALIEQSGDLQGLSDVPDAASESVRELAEEGQYFEAAVVSGVEDAPEADAGPVKTHWRKMDDVPPEYTEQAPDEPKE